MDRAMEEFRGLLHSQPGLMRTMMIGLCGVLLVIFVLRPVASQVTATLNEPLMLTSGAAVDRDVFERREEPISATDISPAEEVLLPQTKSKAHQLQQGIFEHVSDHIRREPAQSTRLLEAWIGTAEGEN